MKSTPLRIAFAALVAGMVWFMWGAFAHMALVLGRRLRSKTTPAVA